MTTVDSGCGAASARTERERAGAAERGGDPGRGDRWRSWASGSPSWGTVGSHDREPPPKHPATTGKGSAKSASAPPAVVTVAAMADGPTILLVEDERSIAEPFAGALEREGFESGRRRAPRRRRSRRSQRVDAGPRPARPRAARRRRARRLPASCGASRTSRSSCSPRAAPRPTGSSGSSSAPTTTSSSRSARAEVIARIRAVLRRSGRDARGGARAGGRDRRAARSTRRAPRVSLDGAELELCAQGVRPARAAGARRRRVVTREDLMSDVWDENWFGSTKTLDVHIGWLRRKLGDDPAQPRFIHTVRGVGFRFAAPAESAVSLRTRLLLALGLRARCWRSSRFEVPLGAEPARPRRRRGALAGRGQADVVAAARRRPARAAAAARSSATSRERPRRRPRPRDRRRTRTARLARRHRRHRRGSAPTTRSRPEIAAALRRPTAPGPARAAARWARDILATAVPIVRERARRRRGAGDAERRRGRPRRAPHVLGLALVGAGRAARSACSPACVLARAGRAAAASASTRRPGAIAARRPRARARRSRAAASSARWRARSTR